MGLYDTVMVACPRCGKRHGMQSKGGMCGLIDYELSEAPFDVLSDVNRHGPVTCDCGAVFCVLVKAYAELLNKERP